LKIHPTGDAAPALSYIHRMTRLIPILLLIVGLFAFIKVSAWHSGRALRRSSRPLMNDQIEALLGRLARTAGIDRVES